MEMILNLLELSLLSLITSAITAVAGMGGGILLLAILPLVLPSNVIIPIHGVVQLSSNLSRFVLGLKDALLKPILLFSMGALIGALLGYSFLGHFNSNIIPLLTSIFILIVLWIPLKKIIVKIRGRYFTLGIFQTATSLFVGTTGPLSTAVLISEGHKPDQVLVTNAGLNTILNILKTFLFFLIGFNFNDYFLQIILMCFFSIIGSKIGMRFRGYLSENITQIVLKVLITLFCMNNIYNFF